MSYSTTAVIPVGPKADALSVVDSIRCWGSNVKLTVLVDDTLDRSLANKFRNLENLRVVAAPQNSVGGYGGLFTKVLCGLRIALECRPSDPVLKLDTDALLIGPGIETILGQQFQGDPSLAIVGSYTTGPMGGRRNWSPAARILRRETGAIGLRHPTLRLLLRETVSSARSNGYIDGEHVLGGAYGLNSNFARDLIDQVSILNFNWSNSNLGEDHLMGLMALHLGYRLGDLSGPNDPFAIEWRGLSHDPDQLVRRKKVLVHSTDYSPTMTGKQVEEFFSNRRSEVPR